MGNQIWVKKSTGWCVVESNDIAEKKFVESPVRVIPSGGYGGGEKVKFLSSGWSGRPREGESKSNTHSM